MSNMKYTDYTNTASDKWAASAARQMARAALLRPGRPDSYYRRYEKILRETAPGGTPRRMEQRTGAAHTASVRPVKRSAPVQKRQVTRTRAEKIQSMLEVLRVCDRSEVQIRSYSPTRRLQNQRRINELRIQAKQNLRKLGYTNV